MKLILIRGLPGSGKSTFARNIVAEETHSVHYEADQYFMHGDAYLFDLNKLHAAHMWCQKSTRQSLSDGFTVVVSNTFTTCKELRPYFKIACECGIIPTVILCQNTFENVHNVPVEKLEQMRNRFQYDISSLFLENENEKASD